MMDDMLRLEVKDFRNFGTGVSRRLPMDKKGVAVSMFKPGEVAFFGAEVMFGFFELASDSCCFRFADSAGEGDLRCAPCSLVGIDAGLDEHFKNCLSGDSILLSDVYHREKVGCVGVDCFGLFLFCQVVKVHFLFLLLAFSIVYTLHTKLSRFIVEKVKL